MGSTVDIQTSYDNISDDNNTMYTEGDIQVSPFEVIQSLAEKLGQEINDPAPNCKKCHGRGYVGRNYETKAPIPCSCIHPKFNSDKNRMMANKMIPLSRKDKRKQDRQYKKMIKRGNCA